MQPPLASWLLRACAVTLALSPIAPVASAATLGGRLAAGLEQTLGGASGLALRYFVSDAVGLTSTFGADLTLADDAEGRGQVATELVGSFGIALHFARSLHAHLGTGLRATIGWRSLTAARLTNPEATGSTLQLNIELPLTLEFFLSEHFSIGASTGLLISIIPERGAVLPATGHGGATKPGAIGIGIGAGSVSGTLSALYYF